MWAGCWLWSSSFKYPNEQDDESWLSAQISADGKTLYYVEARRGKTTAYVTKRRTLGRPFAGDYSIRNTPDKFATGGLFGIKGPTSNAVKPNGQWNTLVLRVAENRVNAAVNGIEVLDTPASLRNIAPLGFICLDGEFPGISYRKMLVYELPQPLKR